jgi:hypothetical protein
MLAEHEYSRASENPEPLLYLPLAEEAVSQCTNGPYLSSRVEREILHFQLHAKKDFSPLARNGQIATQLRKGETKEGVDFGYASLATASLPGMATDLCSELQTREPNKPLIHC